jgi:hypothetical protein
MTHDSPAREAVRLLPSVLTLWTRQPAASAVDVIANESSEHACHLLLRFENLE